MLCGQAGAFGLELYFECGQFLRFELPKMIGGRSETRPGPLIFDFQGFEIRFRRRLGGSLIQLQQCKGAFTTVFGHLFHAVIRYGRLAGNEQH